MRVAVVAEETALVALVAVVRERVVEQEPRVPQILVGGAVAHT